MRIVLVLLLLFLPTISFAVNYCDDANCMGAWLMEEDGNESDVSGEGGTVIETDGDIPQDADKKFGSYSRDWESGDTEYLTHADGLSTDIFGADQTVSFVAFIKRESDSGTYECVLSKYDYGTGIGDDMQYRIRINTSDKVGFFLGGTFGGTMVNATSINTGTWYHIACIYDDSWPDSGTSQYIYLDGSDDSEAQTSYTSGLPDGAAAFTIGCYLDNTVPIKYWDGLIDDVAIFDRELTSVEVSDINTNGLGYDYAPPPAPAKVAPNILIFQEEN